MAEWRYLASRLYGDGTEEIIDPDLPLLGPSFTKVLSGPDAMQGRIAPAVARLVGSDGHPILEPWQTAIYAEEGGVIRHGSILTRMDRSGSELALTGVGFSGAIKDQPYAGSKFFVEEEVLNIPLHIWAHWQSQVGGNLGLVVSKTGDTGIRIGTTLQQVEFDTVNGPVSFEAGPYKLNEWQTHDLGGNIDKLADDHGFHYWESHSWNADRDGFVHRLTYGPTRGTRRHDLRFVVGENVIVPPPESTPEEDYASAVLVLGAGEGATMKRAWVPRSSEKRLRRVHVTTDTSLRSVSAAQARGRALLPMLTGKEDISEISVIEHAHAPLGAWVEGDEVEVFLDTDWGDTSMWVRILSTTMEPDAPNQARLAVVRADKIAA